jgi:hypothetical protein
MPALDTYTWQPMPNKTWKDLVPLIVPFGPTTATYTNDGNGANFIVNNQCRPLCPWTVVDGNGKVLAKATKAGACTNGPMFCCCPLLLMSGQAKTFMILDGQGAEVLTMQQSLYPCWSVISCEGVALFLGAVADCKEFVSGRRQTDRQTDRTRAHTNTHSHAHAHAHAHTNRFGDEDYSTAGLWPTRRTICKVRAVWCDGGDLQHPLGRACALLCVRAFGANRPRLGR